MSQTRPGEHTIILIAVATTVQARLQVVDVDAATRQTNHSKVATGSDVDSLLTETGSHVTLRESGRKNLKKHRCDDAVTVAMAFLCVTGGCRW